MQNYTNDNNLVQIGDVGEIDDHEFTKKGKYGIM